jgi:hypothetical protein
MASDEESNEDLDPLTGALTCPSKGCRKTFKRRTHLVRHFKSRMLSAKLEFSRLRIYAVANSVLDVPCQFQCNCGQNLDHIDAATKHVQRCDVLRSRGENGLYQIGFLVRRLTSLATTQLDQQFRGRTRKTSEFPPSSKFQEQELTGPSG